jgi:hypothetical protein
MNQEFENVEMKNILDRISGLPDEVDEVVKGEPPCVFTSKVLPPVEWDEHKLCNQLKIELPTELKMLWKYASEVRIMMLEEGNCMRSGIYLSSPLNVLEYHRAKISEESSERYIEGDLVIGERVGDLMLFVVRCNRNAGDFGTVLLSGPIDQRKDWEVVGATITEFLGNCLAGKV